MNSGKRVVLTLTDASCGEVLAYMAVCDGGHLQVKAPCLGPTVWEYDHDSEELARSRFWNLVDEVLRSHRFSELVVKGVD